MKLPGVQYGGVQSLGQQDVGGPARLWAAKTNAAQAKAGAIGKLVDTAVNVYDEYDKKKSEEAVKDNELELERRSRQFYETFDQKDHYSASEVNHIPGYENDTRDKIPAHEILPSAYALYMEETVKELSPNIHRDDLRTKWEQTTYLKLEQARGKQLAHSIAVQKDVRNKLVLEEVSIAQSNKQYDIANRLLETSDLSEEVVSEQMLKNQQLAETDLYNEAMRTENIVEINTYIKSLESEEYFDNGSLDPNDARLWVDALRNRRNAILSANEAKGKADNSINKAAVKRMTDNLANGYASTPEQIAAHIQMSADLPDIDKFKLQLAINNQASIAAFSRLPLVQQEQLLSEMKSNPNASGADMMVVDFYDSAYKNNTEQLKRNETDHAEKVGLITTSPISLTSLDEFSSSFAKRVEDYNIVKANFGTKHGLLKPGESTSIAAAFHSADPKTQLGFIAAAYKVNPASANLLFDQIQNDAPAAFQFAARIYNTGNQSVALNVLQGTTLIGNLKDKNKELEMIDKALGAQFGMDATARQSARDASLALLAYNKGMGIESSYTDIVKTVTGGSSVVNGVRITMPPGLPTESFETWTRNIDPSYLDELGGVAGMSSIELSYRLDEGEFKPVDAGVGRYYLYSSRLNSYLQRGDGQGAFILEYREGTKIDPRTRYKQYYEPNYGTQKIEDVFGIDTGFW
jgi:hypothetical protein